MDPEDIAYANNLRDSARDCAARARALANDRQVLAGREAEGYARAALALTQAHATVSKPTQKPR